MIPPPSEAEGLALFQALLEPIPTATLDFAHAYLPHLAAWLQMKLPWVAADLCDEAAVETLYELFSMPTRFDPSRGKRLLSYLHLAAKRDLLNVLRRERRHEHEVLQENQVALRVVGGTNLGDAQEPLQLLCEWEEEQERQAVVQELRATMTEPEQKAFDLMLAGKRATPVFAEVLGLSHLTSEDQENEVKRVKDRIKVRLKRWRNQS